MKTKFGTKLLSLLLCICMLVPMFAACRNKDDETPLSWEATEDQVIPLEMEIQNGDSNTTLVLTYSEDVFSSIRNEQIKLTVYQKAMPSMEEALGGTADESITERTPTDFTASVTNAKQLTITVPNAENDWGYLVTVHSSAISSGKFGEAWGFDSEVIEEYISYSASISGGYATGDVNPVITVTLENTVASAGLTKDMITLTGLFGDLEITSVSGSESTITIVTNGTIAVGTSFFAGVELSEGATNSGIALSADCNIAYRSAYVKQDSFALASGILTFDAVIANDTVTLAVNETLTADGITYTVKAVSEDKTTVTFGVTTAAADLDSAIAELGTKSLEIPGNKMASGNAQALSVYAIDASVGTVVDYIEAADTADTYSATAILYVKNGKWSGSLTASDVNLGGDFDGATVTSVTKNGDVYEIAFTFTKEGLDLDDLSLNGYATVSAGKVNNAWGTALAETDAELTYVTGLDRGETWDAIKAFVTDHKSTFKTIGTVGSAVGGVASAAGGVVTVLEMVGVLESTDAKLDKISKQIERVQDAIDRMNEKLNRMESTLINDSAANLSATDKNIYLTLSGNWSNFVSSQVYGLTNVISEYKSKYNEFLLSWIFNADNEDGMITVYIDADGNVTLPHPQKDNYSIDGKKIVSVIECRLNAPLDDIEQKIMENNGRLYNGYWEEVMPGPEDFLKAQKKGQNTYKEVLSIVYNSAREFHPRDYVLKDDMIVTTDGEIAFDQKTYNFWIHLWGEGGASEYGLWNNNILLFGTKKTEAVSKVYNKLGEVNYWYNDAKVAEMSNGNKKEWKREIFPVDANGNAITSLSDKQFFSAVQLEAAKWALDQVGAINILNAYTNFCNMLAGYGASVSLKPLDNYRMMLETFYNFYKETTDDINITVAWLGGILIEASGVATIAYSFTPSAQQDLVLNAYGRVVDILVNFESDSKDDNYSFVANSVIKPQKVITVDMPESTHLMTPELKAECDQLYNQWLNNKSDDNFRKLDKKWEVVYGNDHTKLLPKNKVSATNILLMVDRYKRLYAANATTATSFAEYLVSLGIMDANEVVSDGKIKDFRILTDVTEYQKSFSKNNSVTLPVDGVTKSTWVKVGDKIKVGKNGKFTDKYFKNPAQICANMIDVNGTLLPNTTIATTCYYDERHSYWRTDEIWVLRDKYKGLIYMLVTN